MHRAGLGGVALDTVDTGPDGFLFRRLHPRWHTVSHLGLTPESIGDIITRRAGNDRKGIALNGGRVPGSAAMED
ncbi:hypothetical protein SALCHL_005968 [Streptomyces albus subsp. chlorinus]|uniref:hypothetical protein n=1 Tax=Streptomyces albus TaxID=1888 RepID=UPI001FACFBDB|nr:hypothetical protein [Streptomyces albus]